MFDQAWFEPGSSVECLLIFETAILKLLKSSNEVNQCLKVVLLLW